MAEREQRRGGIIEIKVNGEVMDAKGEFTATFGTPKRDAIVGSDTVHGYSEEPTAPTLAGKITDRRTLDLKALFSIVDATISMRQANGKTIVLRNAWYSGDATVTTKEGEVDAQFTGLSMDEV